MRALRRKFSTGFLISFLFFRDVYYGSEAPANLLTDGWLNRLSRSMESVDCIPPFSNSFPDSSLFIYAVGYARRPEPCPTMCSVKCSAEPNSTIPSPCTKPKKKKLNSNRPAPNQKKTQFEPPCTKPKPQSQPPRATEPQIAGPRAQDVGSLAVSGSPLSSTVGPKPLSPFLENGVLQFPSDAECGLSPAVLFFFFFSTGIYNIGHCPFFEPLGTDGAFMAGGGGGRGI